MEFDATPAQNGNPLCPTAVCKKGGGCSHAVVWALGMPQAWGVVRDRAGGRSQEVDDGLEKREGRLWDGVVHQDDLPLPNGRRRGVDIGKTDRSD